MVVPAVRGATCLGADDADEMRGAVVELVLAMLERNGLHTDDLISVLFTATPIWSRPSPQALRGPWTSAMSRSSAPRRST